MALVESVVADDMPKCIRLIESIAYVARTPGMLRGGDADVAREHCDDMRAVVAMVQSHALQPSSVFRAMMFPRKVSALMHGLRLEQFTSEGLGHFMREFLCILADDGIEGSGAVSYTHLTLPTKRIV